MQYGKIPYNDENVQAMARFSPRIPAYRGRPERINPICSDDIVNLLIALNASTCLEEFLKNV